MIFRQIFNKSAATYTYLLGNRVGGSAILIDPILEDINRYLLLLEKMDLSLEKIISTHIHADHLTAMAKLRNLTKGITVMGIESAVDVVSLRVSDGDYVGIDGIALKALYTPGHTIESYCFQMADRVFTGDTLLIKGTGRTDFPGGNARMAYDSIFGKLLNLPGDTLIYPGHDYHGNTVSTIAEEIAFNPRLQVGNWSEYQTLMDSLELERPEKFEEIINTNAMIGVNQGNTINDSWAISVDELDILRESTKCVLFDLREEREREQYGMIENSIHIPYGQYTCAIEKSRDLHSSALNNGKESVFYCAYGERSAIIVNELMASGFSHICHLVGGISSWILAGKAIKNN